MDMRSGLRDSLNEMKRYGQALMDAHFMENPHEEYQLPIEGQFTSYTPSIRLRGGKYEQKAYWLRRNKTR